MTTQSQDGMPSFSPERVDFEISSVDCPLPECCLFQLSSDHCDRFIFVVDPTLRVIRINRFLQETLDRQRWSGAIIGRPLFEVFPFLPPHLERRYREVLATGRSCNVAGHTAFEGRVIQGCCQLVPIPDAAGQIRGVLTIIEDTTVYHEAARTRALIEERYRIIARQTGELAYDYRPATGAIDWAGAIEEVTGYTTVEFGQVDIRSWGEHIHPDDRDRVTQELTTALEQGTAFSSEYRFTRKDGSYVLLADHGVFLTDEQGELGRMVGTMRDVTEQRRQEQALRQSEERYRLLVENSPLGIILVEPSGQIVQVNHAMVEILGSPSAEATQRINLLTFPPLVQAGIAGDFQEVLASGTALVAERPYQSLWGREIRMRYHLQAIHDGHGQVACVQGLVEDMTAIRQAEQEKAALSDQLRQAMKMEAIGRLAGGVAHDFNNLLTAIQGYASLALMKLTEQDPYYQHFQGIHEASQRASSLTRQLLAFSRKQVMEPQLLNLNDLVENMHKLLVRVIGEDIELQCKLQHDLAQVRIDPGQFEQVLVNLAVNARDAMASGGVLTIETANLLVDGQNQHRFTRAQPGRYVMLIVSDTGCGMPEEVREHLFEPFFTTKPQGLGTGLGLAIIYGAVKQHGGFIEVYTQLGRGTTFRIFLPAQEGPPSKPEVRRTLPFPGGTETILLVEDESTVRELAMTMLRQLGYTVLDAEHGEAALLRAEQHPGTIHLLLSDVVMPGINGHLLAEHLRVTRPDLKVLLTSGYTESSFLSGPLDGPGIHFIQKPYTIQAIAAKIREVLEEGEGARSKERGMRDEG